MRKLPGGSGCRFGFGEPAKPLVERCGQWHCGRVEEGVALPFGKTLGLLLQPRALACEQPALLLELRGELANALRRRRNLGFTFGEPLFEIGGRANSLLEVVVESSGMGRCFPQRHLQALDLGRRFGEDALALAPEIVLELTQSLDLSRQPLDFVLRSVVGHAEMIGRCARLTLRGASRRAT